MDKTRPRIVVVSHMCPFPPVHGNRSRFVRLLEWFRDNGFAVTFILQPLDVESVDGLCQLRRLVNRLEVVRPRGLGARVLGRIKDYIRLGKLSGVCGVDVTFRRLSSANPGPLATSAATTISMAGAGLLPVARWSVPCVGTVPLLS